MQSDGPRIFTIKRSDVSRCPKGSLLPQHYNDDGSCRCDSDDFTPEVTPATINVGLDAVKVGTVLRYRPNHGLQVRTAKITQVHPIWKDGEPGFDAIVCSHDTLTPTKPGVACWGRLSAVTEVVR